MNKQNLGTFGGIVSAFDPRDIAVFVAQDAKNVRCEDGRLNPRYGFRNLASAQSGFSAVFGFDYLQGYDATTLKEEYVSFETVSSNTRAYSRLTDGSTPTEIKNGGSSVNLNASEWMSSTFRGDAYFINPNNSFPVYRHAIGDATSMSAVTVPDAGTAAPTYTVKYGGGSTAYSFLKFSGLNVSTNITYSGAAHSTNSAVISDGSIEIGHANSNVASSVKMDLSASSDGVHDFTNNDIFVFTVGSLNSAFDIANLTLTFENSSGTTLVPNEVSINSSAGSGGVGTTYYLAVKFSKTDRSVFSSIKYVTFSYTVTKSSSTASKNILIILRGYIGGVDVRPTSSSSGAAAGLYIAYTYVISGSDWESGPSPLLFIPLSALHGYIPGGSPFELGVQLEITVPASGDGNVDTIRLYVQDQSDKKYYRAYEQADSDLTVDYAKTWAEIQGGEQFSPTPFTSTGVRGGFSFKGFFVWLYNGGEENIRMSRVGDALRQMSDADAVDDDERGENFTLADNFSDSPIGGIQAADAAIVAGDDGVYASIGDIPSRMTPFKKVPGSFGVAGRRAFCRYLDDDGQSGMAYLSKQGQVYFVLISPSFSGDEGSAIVRLSDPIRTGGASCQSWLIDGQSAFNFTDFSTAQVGFDTKQEALWVIMGLRALVFRRPDSSGERRWEAYEYNTGSSTVSMRYVSFSPKRGMRFERSNGKVDELEVNSSTGAFITGTNIDGGSAMPAGYWRSKTYTGDPQRITRAKVYRDALTDTPTFTVYSNRTPGGTSMTLASGALSTRIPITAMGSEFSYKVSVAEGYSSFNRIELEANVAGRNVNW